MKNIYNVLMSLKSMYILVAFIFITGISSLYADLLPTGDKCNPDFTDDVNLTQSIDILESLP